MTGLLDPFDYVLAEALGMTVEDMQTRMSNDEFLRWKAFYRYRQEMRELAMKEAK